MFVEMDCTIPDGTEVGLEFGLPDTAFVLRPTAEVIHSRQSPGSGPRGLAFRFLALDRDSAERVEQYVHERSVQQEPSQIPVG
jgi:hypothetical protein